MQPTHPPCSHRTQDATFTIVYNLDGSIRAAGTRPCSAAPRRRPR